MKVRKGILKYISPDVPEASRLRAATGLPPEDPVTPEDRLTVLFVLGHDRSPGVAVAAKKSLEEYPLELVLEGLKKRLDPLVLKRLVALHGNSDAVLSMAAL